MEGVCAAVLLVGGGLTALQSASIATGLPFTLVLLIMCWSLFRGLREEQYHAEIIAMIRPERQKFEIPVSEAEAGQAAGAGASHRPAAPPPA